MLRRFVCAEWRSQPALDSATDFGYTHCLYWFSTGDQAIGNSLIDQVGVDALRQLHSSVTLCRGQHKLFVLPQRVSTPLEPTPPPAPTYPATSPDSPMFHRFKLKTADV